MQKLSEKSLDKMREIFLAITPEISELLGEFKKIDDMKFSPGQKIGENISQAEATGRGIDMVKKIIDILLDKQYDRIIKILAAIYEIKGDELEEKSLGEVYDMITDTLSDRLFVNFFPRFRSLAQKKR